MEIGEDLMQVLQRPIFQINGFGLTIGLGLVIGVLVYLAFFRK